MGRMRESHEAVLIYIFCFDTRAFNTVFICARVSLSKGTRYKAGCIDVVGVAAKCTF